MTTSPCWPGCRVPTGSSGSARARGRGFTLIELVLVLTLLAIMVSAAVPAFRGLKDEQAAREPVATLARLAKETRLRAMKEKRPYQIAFTGTGFTATRYISPYLQMAELEEFLQLAAQEEQEAEAAGEPQQEVAGPVGIAAPAQGSGRNRNNRPAFQEWTERYELPAGTLASVKFWYEPAPLLVSGDMVKLWVFQPSGMVQPMTIRFQKEAVSYEATFSALTADIVSEKSGEL